MVVVKNVSKRFSNEYALNGVSFTIEDGDIFGIVGHSGAGKSTLLRCINGLEQYDSGSILVHGSEVNTLTGEELRNLRKNIGMIFQNFNLMNRKNVYENIAFPLQIWKYNKAEIKDRVQELLKLVGLEDKCFSKIKELSGGQKQRVGIARALALNPKILLCDEATSALDPNTTKSILQLLWEINKKLGITIIIVTHQMEVIKEVCSKVIMLESGEIKVSGAVEDLFMKPSKDLKKLLGEDELLPAEGINIKIYFPKTMSESTLITSIARNLNIDFSIVWGRLEKFREDVLGSLIINVDKEHKDNIIEYLNSKDVIWEVIESADN